MTIDARSDETLNKIELLVLFDRDDVDAGFAELDRLHAEVEAGMQHP